MGRSEPADLLPEWMPYRPWIEYEEMRKKMKRPLTPYARMLAIRKLDRLRLDGNDPTEVLDQSIFNCWQGLFPIQNNGRQVEENEIVVQRTFGKRTA
jgi:hypothetical protein